MDAATSAELMRQRVERDAQYAFTQLIGTQERVLHAGLKRIEDRLTALIEARFAALTESLRDGNSASDAVLGD